ncbi:MAG TPA: RagB/SusD family nutrient uptake outer membrane protein, partial [Sphingobacteriaceae bacterium]
MKKKLQILLVFVACALVFAGCSKQLEEENTSNPVADVYYKTAKGYSDLINSCYTQTRSQMNGEGIAPMIYGTDLWTNASDAGANEFNTYLPALQPSNSILYNLWAGYYLGIAACNTAITRAKDVLGMQPAELSAKTAEAHFLRAWYYHNLVVHFGGVPLKTEEVTEVETTATRATEDEVYAQIISDLKTAEQSLPATQSDFGRATKAAAQALLARIYITRNNNEEALTYANKVINDYNFNLLPDYGALWDVNNRINSEIIWAIQFSQNNRLNTPANSVHLYFTPRYDLQAGMTRALIYDRPYPRYMATRFYLDLMQQNRWRDSRYDKSWREVYLANYEPTLPAGVNLGDTAFMVVPYEVSQSYKNSKKYKILDITTFYNGENSVGSLQIYPKLKKYDDPNRASINDGNGTRDVIEIRLAEMYLIGAEALLKLGRLPEGADMINAVRERAAWPGKEEDMKITGAQLTLDFILDERALELGGERQRWADLKRTGKLMERVKLYNPAGRNNIQEKHLLRPIPSQMIDRLTNKAE